MYTETDIREIDEQIEILQQKRNEIINQIDGQDNDTLPDFILEFEVVDSLEITSDTRVVYQGVPGAYSHQAMYDFFGSDIRAVNVARFDEVIEAIKTGQADYGILPIENSSAGFVNGIYDLLSESDVTIVGENEIRVAHALLGTTDAELSDITDVYSHEQGLLQCKDYLDDAGFKLHTFANTAMAAKEIKKNGNRSCAAIASPLAAEIYGLKILKTDIVNNRNNTTKFIILSGGKVQVKSLKNVCICFSLPDESGTLYKVLRHINHNGINMTSIESRPLQGRKWEYKFFVTLEGGLTDQNTIRALKGIEKDSINFKIIGTY